MTDKINSYNIFTSGTGANAIKMNQNFTNTKTTINSIIDDISTLDTELDEANAKFDKLLSCMFVGQFVPLCRSDYPNGILPCNGGEYDRATFPSFYSDFLLTGKVLSCSYDTYEQEISNNGVCMKFALDAVSEKFRTPTLINGVLLGFASSSAENGVYYPEGLPDLEFSYDSGVNGGGRPYAGKDYVNCEPVGTSVSAFDGGGASITTHGLHVTASEINDIYGASEHVTPAHVRCFWGVVVANITDDTSEIVWNEVIAELSNKLNKPTVTNDTTSTTVTIANLVNNTVRHYTQPLTSLTITAYETSDISATIWFTAGAGFTLTFTEAILGYIPNSQVFETGKKYVMTMNNGYVIIGVVA